ncbi:MAG: hypothetical protein HYU66_04920 [Armatimonadetes bacterium]|nr:hypothetical protein [Armatimonadota bacterium]
MRAVLLCLACAALAAAQDAPAKKLVEYGWDVPYPDYVRAHIAEMERKPFDGLIFRLKDQNSAFDPRPWSAAAMQPQLDDLAAIQWHTFTDNFLTLYAANNWKMDWFDDAQWANIVANLRLTMRAATAGRCKGICFDPEPYGPDPWLSTEVAPGKPWDQLEAVVRKRGQQWMQALQEEMPDARILSLFQLTLFTGVAQLQDPAARNKQLAGHHYGLFPAFFNGWLDVIGPGIRLIDGNESSYYYTNTESYYYAYHYMKQGALTMVDAANRDKYIAQSRAGQALYVDQVLAMRGDTPVIAKWLDKPLPAQQRRVCVALQREDELVAGARARRARAGHRRGPGEGAARQVAGVRAEAVDRGGPTQPARGAHPPAGDPRGEAVTARRRPAADRRRAGRPRLEARRAGAAPAQRRRRQGQARRRHHGLGHLRRREPLPRLALRRAVHRRPALRRRQPRRRAVGRRHGGAVLRHGSRQTAVSALHPLAQELAVGR